MNTGKFWPETSAESIPGSTRAQRAAPEGRHVKRSVPFFHLEQRLFKKSLQLHPSVGFSLPEWRILNLGPQAGAIGGDDKEATIWGQNTPQLAHEGTLRLNNLEPMHDKKAIETRIGKRKILLVDKASEALTFGGPGCHPLRRWYRCHYALGFTEIRPQIRRGVAKPKQPMSRKIAPNGPQAMRDQQPRNLTLWAIVEGIQRANLNRHG